MVVANMIDADESSEEFKTAASELQVAV